MAKHLFDIYRKNKQQFLMSFVIGLITHLYVFTNYLPGTDSMYAFEPANYTMIDVGRWFSRTAAGILSSQYEIYWLTGVVSTVFLCLTIVLIIEMFELSGLYVHIACALFMVFPCVASTFCYDLWAAAYCFSYFLAILALYICVKGNQKIEILIAAVLFCFSMGIYQIYITTAGVCFLYYIIFRLFKHNFKEESGSIARVIAAVLAGGVLYIIINQIVLQISGSVLGDYQGVSSVGKMSFTDIIYAFKKIVLYARDFFVASSIHNLLHGKNLYGIINVLFLVLAVISWIKFVLLNKNITVKNRVIIGVCLILSIFATYILVFVSPEAWYHMLMQTGNYFVYFGILMLLCHNKTIHKKLKTGCICLCCILCFYHFVNDNIAYKRQEAYTLRTKFELMEILMKVDEVNNKECSKFALCGKFKNNTPEYNISPVPYIIGTGTDIGTGNLLKSQHAFEQFAKYWFNRSFEKVDTDEIEKIKKTEAFQKMDTYPHGDYVKIIEDTIVIKISEE